MKPLPQLNHCACPSATLTHLGRVLHGNDHLSSQAGDQVHGASHTFHHLPLQGRQVKPWCYSTVRVHTYLMLPMADGHAAIHSQESSSWPHPHTVRPAWLPGLTCARDPCQVKKEVLHKYRYSRSPRTRMQTGISKIGLSNWTKYSDNQKRAIYLQPTQRGKSGPPQYTWWHSNSQNLWPQVLRL